MVKNNSPFRTEVSLKKTEHSINHNEQLFLIGSCFSENIFSKFIAHKFKAIANPFGIIYNPISIASFLTRTIQNNLFSIDDIDFYNEQYFNFEQHTSLNSNSKNEHLKKLNDIVITTHQYLKTTDYLFITFGTAFVYEHIENKKIVANCHKIPNTQFEKKRLSTKQILDAFSNIINGVNAFNPNCKIIFTVSPVRHWKDGVIENQRSKATLHLAIDYLQHQFSQASYFPSYEIVMDDLRDYRFFEKDMLHPNEQAIEYIWQKFSSCYFDEETNKLNQTIEALLNQFNHKPFNKNSEAHKSALTALKIKMQSFQKENEVINFDNEINQINLHLA